jgi:hypothetical protein
VLWPATQTGPLPKAQTQRRSFPLCDAAPLEVFCWCPGWAKAGALVSWGPGIERGVSGAPASLSMQPRLGAKRFGLWTVLDEPTYLHAMDGVVFGTRKVRGGK